MSFKKWKDNELSTLLTEKWGFSFNLLAESENREDPAGDEFLDKRPGEEDPDDRRERDAHADDDDDEEGDYDDHEYVGADFFDEEGLDERRGRGRDREGMEPDSRRRAMSEGEEQEELEEADKPDFLDLDKDGDKEESMKDAATDKKESMTEAKVRQLIRKLVKEASKRERQNA